ncbi:MAG: cytochrome ubiquinol oxidase subunit I [Treponema sp.]|jgi:cytochrome d ubiquinol oxidase subunit I|nr:cytochrome ubiquinol oxidase subunit I [Treponema sp.]
MEGLFLARLQFAATSVYHFFFVPLTLGLGILVAIMQTRYVQTDDEKYKKMTLFWGKLYLINFAMGVVTGIVQEFHFGMNWAGYSAFVGDIFGAPLAIEALLAFFLESTFLGVWIFGWNRLSKKVHLASIWLVAFASNLSAFWILVANSFMQAPVGFEMAADGSRALMNNFPALLTNPHALFQFFHVITAGLVTAAFFIMGISAYHLIKKNNPDFFKKSFKYGAVAGIIAGILVSVIGHLQGQYLTHSQPMKMAAAEALWDTADPASLAIVAGIDEANKTNTWEIAIPGGLSFMNFYSFTSGEVQGINQLQAQYDAEFREKFGDDYKEVLGTDSFIPPVGLTFWSFRIMFGLAIVMALLGLLAVIFTAKGTLEKQTWYLKIMFPALFLPYIASSFGWIMAEVGRQPWVVYGLQTVQQGLSDLPLSFLVISFTGFVVIYTALAIVDVYLLMKASGKFPAESGADSQEA